MTYDALAVANYLVDLDLERFGKRPHLTNMALQKILYFADGRYMAEHNGQALFLNPIEAWDYGPVVPDVYHAFKGYGSGPIDAPAAVLQYEQPGAWRSVTPRLPITEEAEAAREFLRSVYNQYAERPATALMEESHVPGGPWAQVYRRGHKHVPISPELMREYFSRH